MLTPLTPLTPQLKAQFPTLILHFFLWSTCRLLYISRRLCGRRGKVRVTNLTNIHQKESKSSAHACSALQRRRT